MPLPEKSEQRPTMQELLAAHAAAEAVSTPPPEPEDDDQDEREAA